MGDKLYSQEDAHSALNGTVCVFQGIPYYVTVGRYPGDDIVGLHNLDGRINIDKPSLITEYTNKDFSYKAPELGFVNLSGVAIYVFRHPIRSTKQGLSIDHISTSSSVDPTRILISPGLRDCIMNVYPSFSEALSRLHNDRVSSVAFNKRFAIKKTRLDGLELWHRNNLVASGNSVSDLTFFNKESESILRQLTNHAGMPI